MNPDQAVLVCDKYGCDLVQCCHELAGVWKVYFIQRYNLVKLLKYSLLESNIHTVKPGPYNMRVDTDENKSIFT